MELREKGDNRVVLMFPRSDLAARGAANQDVESSREASEWGFQMRSRHQVRSPRSRQLRGESGQTDTWGPSVWIPQPWEQKVSPKEGDGREGTGCKTELRHRSPQ